MSPCRTKGDGGRVNKPGDKLEIESLRNKMATEGGILFFFLGPGRGSDEGGLFRRLSQQQAASSEQRRCSFQKTTSPSSGSTRRAAGCLLLAPPLCALDTSPPFQANTPFFPPLSLSYLTKETQVSFFLPSQVAEEHQRKTKRPSEVAPLVSIKSLLFCDYFLFSKNRNKIF